MSARRVSSTPRRSVLAMSARLIAFAAAALPLAGCTFTERGTLVEDAGDDGGELTADATALDAQSRGDAATSDAGAVVDAAALQETSTTPYGNLCCDNVPCTIASDPGSSQWVCQVRQIYCAQPINPSAEAGCPFGTQCTYFDMGVDADVNGTVRPCP